MHDLPFQTITQLAGLGLTLIAGWFLGLASHGGGRKWRARLEEAETENAGYRDRAESDLREAARRIRDLEAENTRLKAAPPAPVATPAPAAEPEGHSTTTVAAAAVAGAVAGAAVTHAVEEHAEAVQAPAHAEPAHVETAHAETAHAEPASEPAPAEPVHDTPAEQAEPAHPEHTH